MQTHEDGVLVALGRHAFSLVAQDLRASGVSNIAIPQYYCETMVVPFELEGFHIAHIAVGLDLQADPAALRHTFQAVATPSRWALLHCEVFGAGPSAELRAQIGELRSIGVCLVVDTTHRWPLGSHLSGDYIVSSIRKFTGDPDGALCQGGNVGGSLGPKVFARGEVDDREVSAWRTGDHDLAEDIMDQEMVPVAISSYSRERLAIVDAAKLVRERIVSSVAITRELRARNVVILSPEDSHFCVAFRHPEGPEAALGLIIRLAENGIDGPVWWPRPGGYDGPWPEDVVTLPVAGIEPHKVLSGLAEQWDPVPNALGVRGRQRTEGRLD